MKSPLQGGLAILALQLTNTGHANESGFYAGAEFGVTETTVGKSDGIFVSLAQLPGIIFHVWPSTTSSDGADPGGGAWIGYRIGRYVAAEIGYTDYGTIDIRETYVIGLPPFTPQFVDSFDTKATVTGPSLSLLGILPMGEDFEVFGRAGVLFADKSARRLPGGESDSIGHEKLFIGGGIRFQIAGRLSARIAYESVDRLPKGERTGSMRLERFVFGVSYDF